MQLYLAFDHASHRLLLRRRCVLRYQVLRIISLMPTMTHGQRSPRLDMANASARHKQLVVAQVLCQFGAFSTKPQQPPAQALLHMAQGVVKHPSMPGAAHSNCYASLRSANTLRATTLRAQCNSFDCCSESAAPTSARASSLHELRPEFPKGLDSLYGSGHDLASALRAVAPPPLSHQPKVLILPCIACLAHVSSLFGVHTRTFAAKMNRPSHGALRCVAGALPSRGWPREHDACFAPLCWQLGSGKPLQLASLYPSLLEKYHWPILGTHASPCKPNHANAYAGASRNDTS